MIVNNSINVQMKSIENNNKINNDKNIFNSNDLNKNNNNFEISDIINKRLIINDSSDSIPKNDSNKNNNYFNDISNRQLIIRDSSILVDNNIIYPNDSNKNNNLKIKDDYLYKKKNYFKIDEKKNNSSIKEDNKIVYYFAKLEHLNQFVENKKIRKEKILDYTGCEIFFSIVCPSRTRENYMQNKMKIFEALNVYIEKRFECKSFMNIYEEQKKLKNIVFDENQYITFDYVSKDFSDIFINHGNSDYEISKKIYNFYENYNRSTKYDKFDENLLKYMEDSLREILEH